jgi:membrane protein DedA with SNARE-associated domain
MLEAIITQFGYLVVFIGAILEGETVVVLAGYFAHKGLLNIFLVVILAFFGAVICDQMFFFLGYFKGKKILRRIPKDKIRKIHSLIRKYDTLYIIGFRFLYGMRTISPLIIGSSRVNILKFVLLNISSAFIWAVIFASGGYFFGQVFSRIVGRVEVEILLLAAVTVIIIYFIRKKLKAKT